MSFYSEMREVGLALISEFGQRVEIKRTKTGGYSPYGGYQQGAAQTQNAAAVFQPLTAGNAYRDGTLVQIGDNKVTVAAKGLSFAPEAGDSVKDANGVLCGRRCRLMRLPQPPPNFIKPALRRFFVSAHRPAGAD